MRNRIATDPELLAFHEGRSSRLPTYYRAVLKERLGDYAELLSEQDLTPELEPAGGTGLKDARHPAVRNAPRSGPTDAAQGH
jgi:hypothetical protein